MELSINLSTLAETSYLLGGYRWKSLSSVRCNQNPDLLSQLQALTTAQLDFCTPQDAFYIGCLDFLAYTQNQKQFFILMEYNGSTVGGTTSMVPEAYNTMLGQLASSVKNIQGDHPIVLSYFSSSTDFTHNKNFNSYVIAYEKLLFAEAIKRGLLERYGKSSLVTINEIIDDRSSRVKTPTVIVGEIRDILSQVRSENNQLYLADQSIHMCMGSRLIDHIITKYGIDYTQSNMFAVNEIYPIEANKGIAYKLYNNFIASNSFSLINKPIIFNHAHSQDELIHLLLQYHLVEGKQLIIKPRSKACGIGIEFFLQDTSEVQIYNQVQRSINSCYSASEGYADIYPYTITEFIDSNVIQRGNVYQYGHKYEIRIIVYKEGSQIKAHPAFIKVAPQKYNEHELAKTMLINNISSSALGITDVDTTSLPDNTERMLPLLNLETLELLDLDITALEQLCKFSTEYIRFCIQENHCSNL